jgi:hypothetical protein
MTAIRKITGTALAATAAAMLMAGTVGLTVSPAQAEGVKCAGINSCKGTSECKTAKNSCKGMNECKGHGWVSQASAEACTAAGGTVVEG